MIARMVVVVGVLLSALPGFAQQAAADGPVAGAADSELSREELLMREVEARLQSESGEGQADADSGVSTPVPSSEAEADSSTYRETLRAIKDSVLVLTRKGATDLLQSFAGTTRNSRERGYGGCLGPDLGVHAIDISPVRELIDTWMPLSSAAFGMNAFEPFMMIGGMGYGGLGNGIRVGGAGYGGQRSFTTLYRDTTWVARIDIAWGGFLLEKAYVRDKMNYSIGGLFGGGSMSLKRDFHSGGIFDVGEIDDNATGVDAGFMMIEGHGGFTYSVLPWMHIGMAVSAPLMYSPSGFKSPGGFSLTSSFFSVNPGLRLRLVFGNIG